ncbi:MAG TPA: tetratricopeptide repeat protein, partial [Desulfurivibrionaceae bacterium]|nr:tetratricopeptide repeat protein [Desulfurivibrionaceae bacterium]
QNKRNEAAQVLAAAVMEKDNAGRLRSLTKVAEDYSGTGAALWSRIELGNQASRDKKYPEALAFYTEVYEDLPGDSPLRPLLEYALAQNNENAGKLDQAQLYYRKLADNKSFRVIALSAQGRILESKGDKVGALKVYQEAAEDQELSGQSRSILAEKINTLQTASPAKGS